MVKTCSEPDAVSHPEQKECDTAPKESRRAACTEYTP